MRQRDSITALVNRPATTRLLLLQRWTPGGQAANNARPRVQPENKSRQFGGAADAD